MIAMDILAIDLEPNDLSFPLERYLVAVILDRAGVLCFTWFHRDFIQ
jgi:hypothetical protein